MVSETGQCLPEAAAIELWGTGHPLLVDIMALFGPPSHSGPSLADPSEKIEAKGGGVDIAPSSWSRGGRREQRRVDLSSGTLLALDVLGLRGFIWASNQKTAGIVAILAGV